MMTMINKTLLWLLTGAVGGFLILASCEKSASPDTDEGASAAASSDPAAAFDVVSRVVEASCGECNFALPGSSCDLAVRIDGKAYFVDGFSIDDFGDAQRGRRFLRVRPTRTGERPGRERPVPRDRVRPSAPRS